MWLHYTFAEQYLQWANKVDLYRRKIDSELSDEQKQEYNNIIKTLLAEMRFTEIAFEASGLDLHEALYKINPDAAVLENIGEKKISTEEVQQNLLTEDTWVKYALTEGYWSSIARFAKYLVRLSNEKLSPGEREELIKLISAEKGHKSFIENAVRSVGLDPVMFLKQASLEELDNSFDDNVIPMFIFQLPGWPNFYWDPNTLSDYLAAVRRKQISFVLRMESLEDSLSKEIILQTITLDIQKSWEIEGEHLDKNQIRSSVARRLGLGNRGAVPTNRNVERFVAMMLDASQNYYKPLTKERLFKWHALLFPSVSSGVSKVNVGAWRDDAKGPMQVVSGPIGRERLHFQAPPAERIEKEMMIFLTWFNRFEGTDPLLHAAIAHLWFVTIHPFGDGNGRIARAITEIVLARSEDSGRRFYSLSAQIRKDREEYYDMLEDAQKGTLDITDALRWFIDCLGRAIDAAEARVAERLSKARLLNSIATEQINDRQKLVLGKLLDDFKGKLTISKWAKLAKCSEDTAAHDIEDLVTRGVIEIGQSTGRSTSYILVVRKE